MHSDHAIYHFPQWCLPATLDIFEVIQYYLHTALGGSLHLERYRQLLTAKRVVTVDVLRDTDETGNRKRLCVDGRDATRARVCRVRRRHGTATLGKSMIISESKIEDYL